jgi:hypothetical protein
MQILLGRVGHLNKPKSSILKNTIKQGTKEICSNLPIPVVGVNTKVVEASSSIIKFQSRL